ncbi:hypothetical protein MG293_007375 [Ovis ammon polii]|uniref:Uncharacterized protein n=1 Tax=Ovis ammon polii TaxID=230172 RepID=A0AAD4UBI5_OVIAM|nr:hypothetical protein MG293_007375 [Ovis ammon polii]
MDLLSSISLSALQFGWNWKTSSCQRKHEKKQEPAPDVRLGVSWAAQLYAQAFSDPCTPICNSRLGNMMAIFQHLKNCHRAKHVGKDVKKELQAKMTTTSDSPSKGPSGDSSSGNFLKVTVRESHRYSITTEKYFPHSALTPDGFYQSLLPPGLLSPSSTTDSE